MTRARDLAAGTFELATGGVLKLETSDTTVTDGSVLGKIEFKAPDEASGTDAILVGAAIEAVAEGTFAADNNATEFVFKTGASAAADAKMTLTSGGDLLLSGGVYLGGTGAANKLSDVETGTWTPAPTRTSSAPTVGFSVGPNGSYVKIGRMVYASFDLTINSYSGGSGTALLSGLPFAVANSTDVLSGYSVVQLRSSASIPAGPTATTIATGFGERGASYIFFQYDNIGNAGSGTNSSVANWQTGRLTGYILYPASS